MSYSAIRPPPALTRAPQIIRTPAEDEKPKHDRAEHKPSAKRKPHAGSKRDRKGALKAAADGDAAPAHKRRKCEVLEHGIAQLSLDPSSLGASYAHPWQPRPTSLPTP